jgi:tetratricopeptide (TPR) repeat protein
VTPQATSELERRFGTKAAECWQHVLEHIRLSNGFSYLILLVPEASAARICAAELVRHLRDQGQELESREFNTPEALREHLAPWVLRETGQQHPIWAASVTSEYDPQHSEWEAAWRYAVARINERRDELIKRHQAPIIMVGAPWLKTVLREAAPDWWSVRSMVVNLKPQFVPSDRKERNLEPVMRMLENDSSDALLDPDEVLEQAELLRGVAGQEENLIVVLERVFDALAARERWVEAEEVSREVLELELRLGKPMLAIANSYHDIGDSMLGQERFVEAEKELRKALELKENNNASLMSQGSTLHALGITLQKQEKLEEAQNLFISALKFAKNGENSIINQGAALHALGVTLWEQGNLEDAEIIFKEVLNFSKKGRDSLMNQGIALDYLGKVLQDQGKLEEAENLFREALRFKENGGDSLKNQGSTLVSIGRVLQGQGKLEDAEITLRKALRFAEDGGDSLIYRGWIFYSLALTLQEQGKLEDAAYVFRKALDFGEMGGETQENLEIARNALINVLQELERWSDAEDLIRQVLEQKESHIELDRDFLWSSLEDVLKAQGRTEEAQEAAKHLLAEL